MKVLNSLELVGETVRHALNVLATVVPEWLKQQVKPEWFDRYGQRMEDYRLPKDKSEREALSTTIGEDGFFLLTCIQQAKDMQWRGEASGDPNLVRGLEATISPRAGTGLSPDPKGDASGWGVDSLSLRYRSSLWQKAKIRVDWI